MKNLQTKTIPFELKTVAESDDGAICTFEGLGAAFYSLDGWGDIIEPGAFAADLGYMTKEGKIRDEHCTTTGRIVAGEEVAAGLQIKGEIYATTAGKDQRVLLRTKTITRLSIGYVALKRCYLEGADAVKAYWQSKSYTPDEDDLLNLGYYGYARLLQRVRVGEVSTTWWPANKNAEITAVKSGPRKGRSFADESAQALDALDNLLNRAEAIQTIRAEAKRGLSPETKSRLNSLRTRLDSLAALPEAKAAEPPAPDADALHSQFLAIQSRLLGVAV